MENQVGHVLISTILPEGLAQAKKWNFSCVQCSDHEVVRRLISKASVPTCKEAVELSSRELQETTSSTSLCARSPANVALLIFHSYNLENEPTLLHVADPVADIHPVPSDLHMVSEHF
nr:uncharacterized protein LOC127334787 [Lolium perenne]XP_051217288.1 uncharacterized protein LOC127334787 [Lolium perenne]